MTLTVGGAFGNDFEPVGRKYVLIIPGYKLGAGKGTTRIGDAKNVPRSSTAQCCQLGFRPHEDIGN